MCLSPQSRRSNISNFFKDNNTYRNKSKDDTNKLNYKKLTSRNNEILSNKKDKYKKIIPKNLMQFSSNNSNTTSSNNSNLNNAQTYKNIFREYELGYKDSDFIKKNIKHFNKKDSSKLVNNKKEKYENFFKKYKKKIYNNSNNSKINITNIHNRTMNKNTSKDLIISKVIDKLAVSNLNKLNNLNNINLSSNSELIKYDIDNTLLGSITTKNYNSFMNSSNNKIFNFPISTNYKNIKSVINIKSSKGVSRYSAKTSSAKYIHSKNSKRKINTYKPHYPNSNDNIKRNNNNQKNKKVKKVINLSKSKNNVSLNLNKEYLPDKKIGDDVRLNNNKIEYVQINLFNNGNNKSISKKNIKIFNEVNKKSTYVKNKEIVGNQNENNEILVDINDNEGIHDNIVVTKSFLCFNNKACEEKNIQTPEENHFQAILYIQKIKNNNKIFT